MKQNCICCESNKLSHIGHIPSSITFAGRVLEKSLEGGELICCNVCGLYFRYPQLDKSELDNLYEQGDIENWLYNKNDRFDWSQAKNWIEEKNIKNLKVLDVGCFNGQFLSTLGNECKLYGIEIHEAAALKAQELGVKVVASNIDGIKSLNQNFDVITAFDVIEHVHNPYEFLTQLSYLLNDDGMLIISSGNTEALSWRIQKEKYWYCVISEHISFINPRWCHWAANQLNLELLSTKKFSHQNSTLFQKSVDFIKNVIFRIFPYSFILLRKLGFGSDIYRHHDNMLNHPPSWITAKDHCIYLFNKKHN